jgi:hypothetical protein
MKAPAGGLSLFSLTKCILFSESFACSRPLDTGCHPNLRSLQFYVTRVQDAVNQQLQAKGWTLAPTGGSVTVFATDNIHDQKQIQTMYDGLGGGWGGGWGWGGWGWGDGWGPGYRSGIATTTTTDQNIGTLVIDLFDGSSKQILWRGLATENLSSNDQKNTKQLDQDIAKMFKPFPPKPGK